MLLATDFLSNRGDLDFEPCLVGHFSLDLTVKSRVFELLCRRPFLSRFRVKSKLKHIFGFSHFVNLSVKFILCILAKNHTNELAPLKFKYSKGGGV